jgi:D-amino peptidase
MKIYISADIEGVAGITHWDEANISLPANKEFREEMTNEVVAVCEAAIEAGATEIVVKDAHGSGRNIFTKDLPECVKIIRGWSGSPLCMVQELDETFDAVLFVGYHSKGSSEANPLAHTLFASKVAKIEINGEVVSEFLLHAFAASLFAVPIVFLSGDMEICKEAEKYVPSISTVPVLSGVGPSTISMAPKRAAAEIRKGVKSALVGSLEECRIRLPDHFTMKIFYATPVEAYRASWYPGAIHSDPMSIVFDTSDYFEVLRAIRFKVLN